MKHGGWQRAWRACSITVLASPWTETALCSLDVALLCWITSASLAKFCNSGSSFFFRTLTISMSFASGLGRSSRWCHRSRLCSCCGVFDPWRGFDGRLALAFAFRSSRHVLFAFARTLSFLVLVGLALSPWPLSLPRRLCPLSWWARSLWMIFPFLVLSIPWLRIGPGSISFLFGVLVGRSAGGRAVLMLLAWWNEGMVHEIFPVSSAISTAIHIESVQLPTVQATPRIFWFPHGLTYTLKQNWVSRMMRLQKLVHTKKLWARKRPQALFVQIPGESRLCPVAPQAPSLWRCNLVRKPNSRRARQSQWAWRKGWPKFRIESSQI